MQQIKKMGPLGNLIGMMPGMPKEVKDVEIEDSHVARLEAIIRSMTPEERAKPEIIDGSRRLRIANGSGAQPQDVNGLVKQFAEMQKMMKQFGMTPKKPKRKGGKKSKKRRGGRTTAKGPAPMADPSVLLDEGLAELESLPGGLRLPGLPED
jgi:signal recognition particle subunit SRP54